ncbi:YdeI/OmpD-associated family protein [Brevundimonas goettingensis]|uniref:YdeI/OmpD-associated family protein n=1 Tax=Brevundimonas goettingensis TaxID=2774190 RepID=A0A975C3W0_9CAUL|nr:YdeI/OmpD-associated family protein [Brevundimonas goettingensis]QTC91395.1 YdeI/OmpD-associated family protein [Brevundimonas goettingensis]
MAPVVVDPKHVHAFADEAAFEAWLAKNHVRETEIWIRIYKVKSGTASITVKEAIDVCLCWGWIDGIKKSFDEASFLQRYTPRGKKSVWSQVNVDNVARLTEAGRMTVHGHKHIEAAKADGRWDAAYRIKGSTLPDDFVAAVEAVPEAKATLDTLSAQNRFALIFRLQALKTEAGRQKAIARFIDMLARGETPHPQGTPK